MNLTLICIAIFLFLLLLILTTYNSLVQLRLKVEQSKSVIDICCQQRFDLIPNLLQAVQGYVNYEKAVINQITELRTIFNDTKNLEVGEELNKKIDDIIAVSEGYPQLMSSEHFLSLQKNLTKIENQLQAARRIYNIAVTTYNTRIKLFPINILAFLFNFKSAPLLKFSEDVN